MTDDGTVREVLRDVARTFGTPAYVYFMDQVRERTEQVRAAFGNRFQLRYAVKSNPNPVLLRKLQGVVDALDVSSGGEVVRALQANWEAAKLGFTGPGKTPAELQASVEAGVGEIIVESVEEGALLDRIARSAGRVQPVVLRIAPHKVPRGFGLNMSGKPSPFGIDEEEIDAAVNAVQGLSSLRLCGFHIYSGTQCLNAEAIVENFQIFIEIFKRVCSTHRLRPATLIFGSGIGIPYYDSDTPVDLAAVAQQVNPALDELRNHALFSASELVLETGRYLVGEAGIYLTRVIRTKRSRGVDIGICDGGMNHHLAASGHLGNLFQRNYRMFKIAEDDAQGSEQVYNLAGPLCTTIDTLARQVKFRGLQAGDVIGIRSSGAYGLTASPIHFIGHAPAKEILVETVRGKLSVEDISQFDGTRAEGTTVHQ